MTTPEHAEVEAAFVAALAESFERLHADEFEALFLDQLRAVDQEREPST